MRDFYSLLKLPTDAPDETIRAALASAPDDIRADAQFILLEPRRRAVYDRNHQLLTTIGQIRSHMGLSYTRFWARQEYKDFWDELAPPPAPRGRRVDATMIAGAFKAVGRHSRKHVTQKRNWVIAVVVAIALIVVYLIIRLAR